MECCAIRRHRMFPHVHLLEVVLHEEVRRKGMNMMERRSVVRCRHSLSTVMASLVKATEKPLRPVLQL